MVKLYILALHVCWIPEGICWYLFQCSLNLHSLSPGNSWIGKAVTVVCPPGEIDALFVQVAEGLRHHLHCIVGQSWSVLDKQNGYKVVNNRSGNVFALPYPLFNLNPIE